MTSSSSSQGPILLYPICCFVSRYHKYDPVHCRQQYKYFHADKPAMYTDLGRSMRLEHMDKGLVGGETLAVLVNSLTAENSEKAQGCFFGYR